VDLLALRAWVACPKFGTDHMLSGSLNCAWLHALNSSARNLRTRYLMEEGRRREGIATAALLVTERYLVDKHVDGVIQLVVRLSVISAGHKCGVERRVNVALSHCAGAASLNAHVKIR